MWDLGIYITFTRDRKSLCTVETSSTLFAIKSDITYVLHIIQQYSRGGATLQYTGLLICMRSTTILVLGRNAHGIWYIAHLLGFYTSCNYASVAKNSIYQCNIVDNERIAVTTPFL